MHATLPDGGWAVFLPPHALAFVLFCGLVSWSAWRCARGIAPPRARVVGLGVWASALVVLYAQVLSLVRQLHWPGLLVLAALGAMVAWRVPSAASSCSGEAASPSRGEPGPAARLPVAILALPLAAYGVFALVLALSSTEPCEDNALYHLPRLGYWLQHQSLQPFLANNPRLGSFPPNANILQLVPVLFLRSDRLCALVQLGAFYGAGLAIFGLARDFGASRVAASGAGLCWLTVPTALLQASVSQVDLTTSFFTVATGAFAVAAVRCPGRVNVVTCLAAGCLAIGAKPQAAVFVAPAVALVVLRGWRRDRASARLLLLTSPAAFLVAAWPYVQNLAFFGHASGLRSVEWLVVHPGLPSFVKNAQLMGAHLFPWPRVGFAGFLTGPGLGALWMILVPAGLARLAWTRIRATEPRDRIRSAYCALSLLFFVSILFVMRHQPSVTRFVLPAVALLSVAAAHAIEAAPRGGLARPVIVGVLAAAGAVVVCHHAERDVRGRLTAQGLECVSRHGLRPRCLAFKSPEGMCGREHRPVAVLAQGIAETGPGRRIGVLGSQGYPERLLFGRRFSNVLVPLSYRRTMDRSDLDRLGLDALWMEKGGHAPLLLFRLGPPPPVEEGPEGWRLATFYGFDAPFDSAIRQSTERIDVGPVRRLLEERDLGWEARPVGSIGVMYVRAAGTRQGTSRAEEDAP